MTPLRDQWTSISAIEDAFGKEGDAGCLRRWWFNKIVHLPQPQRASTIFGDVFHAVQARFYMADDRGMDENGRPVNLYPDGWQTMKDRFHADDPTAPTYTISIPEEAVIRVLIDTAIRDGVMVRVPGRRVEVPIERVLITDPGLTPLRVILKGYIDLETPDAVEDHKTAKNTKYIVSAKNLHRNFQMMTYAYDKYQRGHEGDLWIAHNNYIKDFNAPQVLPRRAKVSKGQVEDFFNKEILPCVRRMFEIYKAYPKESVDKWREIPGPYDPNKECNHHFGNQCPFISICMEQCSVPLYIGKFKELTNPTITKGSNEMNLLDNAKKEQDRLKAAATPATPTGTPPQAQAILEKLRGTVAGLQTAPVTTAPVMPPVVTPPIPAPAQPVKQRAPWHIPGCPGCAESTVLGFIFSNGGQTVHACQTCEAMAIPKGMPTMVDYKVWVGTDGVINFQLKNPIIGAYSGVILGTDPIPAPLQPVPPVAVTPPTVQPAGLAAVFNPAPAPVVTPPTPAVIPPVTAGTRKRRTKGQIAADNAAKTAQTTPPVTQTMVDETFTGTMEVPIQEGPAPEQEQTREAVCCKSGFTLLEGCVLFVDGDTTVVSVDDVLKLTLTEIETKLGKTVAAIPHFDLLTEIDSYSPQAAAMLSGMGAWVVSMSPTKGTPMARLLDGLRPFAKKVVVGINR